MRGQWKMRSDLPGIPVKVRAPAMNAIPGHGKLRTGEEAVNRRSVLREQSLMEFIHAQFVTLRILAPRHKETSTARVIGIGQKSQPVEVVHGLPAFGQSTQPVVQVWRMIEGMTLDEDGETGEVIVSLRDVVEIGVRLASDIG